MPFDVNCNAVDDCGNLSDEPVILCGMYCSTCVVGLLLLGSQCEASRGNVTSSSSETSTSCKAGIGGGFSGGVEATIIFIAAILIVKKW